MSDARSESRFATEKPLRQIPGQVPGLPGPPTSERERWEQSFQKPEPNAPEKTPAQLIAEARSYLREQQSPLTRIYTGPGPLGSEYEGRNFLVADKDNNKLLSPTELLASAASFKKVKTEHKLDVPDDMLSQTENFAGHTEDQFTVKQLVPGEKNNSLGVSRDDFKKLAQLELEHKFLQPGRDFLEDHFNRLKNSDGLIDAAKLRDLIEDPGLSLKNRAALLVVQDAYDDIVALDKTANGKGISKAALARLKDYDATLPDLRIYDPPPS